MATPAPNDPTGLAYSEFLGIKSRVEMFVAEYFLVHRWRQHADWRLKNTRSRLVLAIGCADGVPSCVPSDIRFSDDGFAPPLIRGD